MTSPGTFSCAINLSVDSLDDCVGFLKISLTCLQFVNFVVVFVKLSHVVRIPGLFCTTLCCQFLRQRAASGAHDGDSEELSHDDFIFIGLTAICASLIKNQLVYDLN